MSDPIIDDVMERRLQAWGAWLAEGGCGDGFPTKSVLHQSWLPPAAGCAPSMKVGQGDAAERAIHAAVMQMSVRMANTLVITYVYRQVGQARAQRLECQESTARARVQEAKRILHQHLQAHPVALSGGFTSYR